jgi:hypothetical protein
MGVKLVLIPICLAAMLALGCQSPSSQASTGSSPTKASTQTDKSNMRVTPCYESSGGA